MKSILKLSLVSLCASGAVFTTQLAQANHDRSASNKDSDKQLVITEPAGAEASASLSTSGELNGMTIRTSNLIGEKVVDSSGKRCGTVRDALIDLNSGRLAFLVINAHGREIAVPGDAFHSQGNEVMLNIDRDRLNSAPQFSYSNINDPNWASQTYSFYGQSWQGGQVSSTSPSWQSSSTAYESSPSYQSGSSYQSGTSYQSGQQFSEAAGAAPGLVTGHDQDCYADCILHKYQAGKGSARATDEAYWNNVPGDRLYTQYPASSGTYQNYAYNSSSYSSQPSFSSSQQGSGVWYGSGGRTYGSSGAAMSSSGSASFGSSSGVISESAGASSGMHLYRSSELVGMHIRANNGQDLGTIRDVVLDLNSGRVAYAVVAPTSSDFGGKFLAIPPAAFTRGADQHVLSLNMSTDQLRNAPSFEPNNWPQPQNQTFINETYNFYHVQPNWQGHGEGNWQNDNRHMRHHEGTGTDTYHGSQDLNNNTQGSSTSGSIQGSSTSTEQQNLNNQDQDREQNEHKAVNEPSGTDVKGAEHHDSSLNLQGSQGAAGSTSSSVDQSSSSSSLQSSDDQLKKGAERQTDAIREPSGADQSSATQSGTSGAQSSTELKSSQTQSGTATSEAAGAANENESTSTSTSTSTTTSPSSSTDVNSSSSSTEPSTSSSSSTSNPDQTSTSSSSTSTSTQPATSSSSDQGMIEKVRSTFKSDSTLSPISSNVQVADQNGKIALTGTVKSEAEKQQIVSKAEEIAGSGNVIDNLQVKSDSNQ